MSPSPLPYFAALAEARSCLAALADATPYDESIAYEHLLLELDGMHGGRFPATFQIVAPIRELRARLEASLDDLSRFGSDALPVELLPAELDGPPTPKPHRGAHIGPHMPTLCLTELSSRPPSCG